LVILLFAYYQAIASYSMLIINPKLTFNMIVQKEYQRLSLDPRTGKSL